jgi:tetratricopeptide (TPR) repeat protein
MTVLSAIGFGAPPQQDKSAPSYAQPAENILMIVADINRHLNDDVYKFPYAVDVTGQNVFRAAAVRLSYYEEMYPGKMSDVVALSKAQVYEKLTSYIEAGENYEKAKDSSDPSIQRLASEGFERSHKFAEVANESLDKSGLRTYQRDLEKQIRDFDSLIEQYKKTPYACLARLEKERVQMQMAEFYIMFRFMQPYSTNDAIVVLKRNIEENRNSKKAFAHRMMLADLYYSLAREYTVLSDPEGPDFQMGEFENFANLARSEYHVIEQADGYPEKMEARAKMLALEAFVEQINDKAR